MKQSVDCYAGIKATVAIVVPAFNAESYIQETLLSILSSTFRDFVLVVVNDGSTDRTESIVREIKDDRVILINRANAGMSSSRNYGIDLVDSEYIALCDADDLWHPRKLELQIGVMSSGVETDFCYTGFNKYFDGDDLLGFQQSQVTDEIDQSLSGYIYHKMLLTNWPLPSSVVFRRSLWNALGHFLCLDHQTDDWEYFVRASRLFKFAKLKSRLVLYRQPQISLSRRIPEKNSTEEMRASLIARFGLTSPQGSVVDAVELKRRMYVGMINYFDLHVSRGNFLDGASGFLKLLATHPNKTATIVKCAKSLRRRIFR